MGAARRLQQRPRIFVQFLVWQDDPDGLRQHLDEFLSIASEQGISTVPVLFDDCAFAGKEPYLGPQDDPVAGVHNSGWTPSPGPSRVANSGRVAGACPLCAGGRGGLWQ